MWQVASDKKNGVTRAAQSCHVLHVTCYPRQGVALIITLILLAVVTFMAITFLAISRRERNAVTTVTDTASAKLAADAALANAEAQIIANALANTNPFNFGLLVSTNYINPAGFTNNGGYNDVNYYDSSGIFLTGNSFLANLTNLWYTPRPPVFISTSAAGSNDFRFYLDLNRNSRFDPNDLEPVLSPDPANPYYYYNPANANDPLNGTTMSSTNVDTLRSSFVGDPEWVGVLERPDAPHGPNNHFIARYAFIAVPVGNTLDANAIHNQAFDAINASPTVNQPPTGDVYFRNQGVGSWEINLAAFLADLNTNAWGQIIGSDIYYQYNQPLSQNKGHSFEDARALLAWRYNNLYNSLNSVNGLFPFVAATAAFRNNIDGYSIGPLMTNFAGINVSTIFNLNSPWLGADNTNRFFTHQEMFDPVKAEIGVPLPPGFIERLKQGGTNISTYDRYTYYRMLSQLGTDSTPDSGKMNLNYSNALVVYDKYRVAQSYSIIPGAETNFVSWRPLDFFNVAADRLLRAYTTEWRNSNPTNFAIEFYASQAFLNFTNANQWTNYPAFGLNHIPVLISNQFVYSPAVNRLLQLAANLYDASTNNTSVLGMNYPSVFRPVFWVTNEFGHRNVYITGYQLVGENGVVGEVFGTNDFQLATPADVTALPIGYSPVVHYPPYNFPPYTYNVYGVPWIVGAKKGFPSFNKFAMEDVVSITRKLQIRRSKVPITSITDFVSTNQLYVFSVSNSVGMDCWNSYNLPYTNTVLVEVRDNLTMRITDTNYASVWNPPTYSIAGEYPVLGNPGWPGSAPWGGNGQPYQFSIQMPTNVAYQFLTNSGYYFARGNAGNYTGFVPVGLNPGWDTNKVDFTFPDFYLFTTNRLQFYMLDKDPANNFHVIDYVQFAGPDSGRDLNAEIQTNATGAAYENMWSTSLDTHGVPWSVESQIGVSEGIRPLNTSYWSDPSASSEILGFNAFMTPNGQTDFGNNTVADYYASNYIVQVPYTPTVTTYLYTSWQANDPLVHYLTTDLNFYGTEAGASGPRTGTNVITYPNTPLPRPSFNVLNERYQPWSTMIKGSSPYTSFVDQNPSSLAYKDPLVRLSDNWDFPTNKFPTVGWLGRVHRGTPWQSVFLKATNILDWVVAGQPRVNGTNTWEFWTGNFDWRSIPWTAPLEDRLLFDLFTTALNQNATRGTLSVNVGAGLTNNPVAGLAAWSALFSGLVTVSNNAADNSSIRFAANPQYQNPPPFYTATNIIQPAGAYYNPALSLAQQPALVQIVNGINQTRANTNLFPLGAFPHAGDILAVPQLTEQSPFLHWYNWNGGNPVYDGVQITNGISDEMYEWLPQQALSLLRCSSSPRYVIYCYGQALKPAPNGIYTGGGQFFGLVTNYQVVAETAARAVVRFDSVVTNVITTNSVGWWSTVPVVTNNNAVIEQFNILPPD